MEEAGTPSWPSDPVELLQALYPPLIALAWQITRDQAEDLVQETLLRILIRHPNFEGITHPLGYAKVTLFRAARAGLISRTRREVPLEMLEALERRQPQFWEDGVEERLDIQQALEVLHPRRRACVYLRYVGGLDDRHIASILGCRPSTVRSQISRSLPLLRGRLAGHGRDE